MHIHYRSRKHEFSNEKWRCLSSRQSSMYPGLSKQISTTAPLYWLRMLLQSSLAITPGSIGALCPAPSGPFSASNFLKKEIEWGVYQASILYLDIQAAYARYRLSSGTTRLGIYWHQPSTTCASSVRSSSGTTRLGILASVLVYWHQPSTCASRRRLGKDHSIKTGIRRLG